MNRNDAGLRQIKIEKNWNKWAEGSAYVNWGNNIIAVTATLEKKVPKHLIGLKQGWIAVEYRMNPRSNKIRKIRNENRISHDSREIEISRLLGRVLRNTVSLEKIPGKTIWIDCDILQADGGTRMASLLGAYIALYEALNFLKKENLFTVIPINYKVAGVSFSIKNDKIILDPDFNDDSEGDSDINIILNDRMEILEIQGGAEGKPYREDIFLTILERSKPPISHLLGIIDSVINT